MIVFVNNPERDNRMCRWIKPQSDCKCLTLVLHSGFTGEEHPTDDITELHV